MPVESSDSAERPAARAAPSIAVELSYLLYVLAYKNERHEMVRRLAASGLPGRLKELWPEGIREEGTEFALVAEQAGRLFDTDAEALIAELDRRLSAGVPPRGLRTEAPGDRASIEQRLRILAESAPTRAAYVAIIRDLWAELRDEWLTRGCREVESRVAQLEVELERRQLREVLPRSLIALREQYAGILRESLGLGRLVIVPLYFGGEGNVFTELGEHVIVGFGQEADARRQRRRVRSERAAASFKVLADPTRLSILSSLLWEPTTISCLAERFELAQPTVSIHIKTLREAGFLEFEKSGGSTQYSTNEALIRGVVGDALELLFEK